MGKAEITTEYILEKVAPYFNKHGYHATSMSDITSLTGLTKGAIYGNFENKEELALEAFRHNLKKLLSMIAVRINTCETSSEKLRSIIDFYKDYMDYSEDLGGCPILKVGMDSLANNKLLKEKVKSATLRMKKSIEDIVCEGQASGEIKEHVDAKKFANVFYGTIEGGVLLASITGDNQSLIDNLDHLQDGIIQLKL